MALSPADSTSYDVFDAAVVRAQPQWLVGIDLFERRLEHVRRRVRSSEKNNRIMREAVDGTSWQLRRQRSCETALTVTYLVRPST